MVATEVDFKIFCTEVLADIKASENRMIMWVIGAQIAGTGLLLATKLFV